MMATKKRVLLKLTGEIFLDSENHQLTATKIKNLISQIKQLHSDYQFGIVIGGGNFFRGNQHGKQVGISPWCSHQIGMLATMLNGLMINDICKQETVSSEVFSAIECSAVGKPINHANIVSSLKEGKTVIFVGGTGNPFFTTDTNAVLRALQIAADMIWKGTNIDGVYSANPHHDPSATLLKELTYNEAIKNNLAIMDTTAFVLASQHNLKIRVFDINAEQALLQAAEHSDFGSTIHT